ncbi:PTS sugar transporter subunit IIA [Legionella hackeliae]|uniref:Putative PTS IIA-like nitrogen-regulatory protein PtsN n=1 Tax=Legionella hackeliae TaxID=449 RepID=A0A0A8URI3_LEGHA|nr:PTS sugar transporter subunit IIA [Legionella hackeliae]KTD10183.1 Nitrogen regulatory protein [Legionella hackeliae]CEK09677.1 putative PTS IIA-like nitrogen-regulatory protein PtsN [Legionella hackeliae]STX49588.1 Nitrogen regulatory protein [Legionella hackeliae]
MQLCQVIHPSDVCIDSTSHSKTAVLLKISQLLSQTYPELDPQELFDAYWKRECLGSTAIGQGITIPHIRSAAINTPKACVIRLLNPIDFGAEDKQPVDLVIGLVVPQEQVNQHLQLLDAIIKQFSQSSFRDLCRQTMCPNELYQLVSITNSPLETA